MGRILGSIQTKLRDRAWLWLAIALLILFIIGLAIRLYDLTEMPFDFHPTRQLRSALIARGIYNEWLEDTPEWKREMALLQRESQEVLEPQVTELIVATMYWMTGGERLWIGRLLSIFFWMVGTVGLYVLVREMSTPAGGLAAVAFYLLAPFAIQASRSFQPDPLMISLLIFSLLLYIAGSVRRNLGGDGPC